MFWFVFGCFFRSMVMITVTMKVQNGTHYFVTLYFVVVLVCVVKYLLDLFSIGAGTLKIWISNQWTSQGNQHGFNSAKLKIITDESPCWCKFWKLFLLQLLQILKWFKDRMKYTFNTSNVPISIHCNIRFEAVGLDRVG